MVAPMRYQFVQGKRTLMGAGRQSTTDDNGEFRLFGIMPGQYVPAGHLAFEHGVRPRR